MPVVESRSLKTKTLILSPGYGIHYPVRHGQVENWVRSTGSNGDAATDSSRIIWNDSGPIQFSNTYGSNPKITISSLPNLYVPNPPGAGVVHAQD